MGRRVDPTTRRRDRKNRATRACCVQEAEKHDRLPRSAIRKCWSELRQLCSGPQGAVGWIAKRIRWRGGKRRTGVGGACCSWSRLRPCKMETAAGPCSELSGWSTLHQSMLPGRCCASWGLGFVVAVRNGVAPCCDTFLAACMFACKPLMGRRCCESTSARAPKCKSRDAKNHPSNACR